MRCLVVDIVRSVPVVGDGETTVFWTAGTAATCIAVLYNQRLQSRALRRAGRAAAAAEIFGQRRRKSAARLEMRPSPKDSQWYFCRLFGEDVVISQRRFSSNSAACYFQYLQLMAHGLHNLIVVDGVGKYAELQELIVKVISAVKTFTYKTSLLESEAAKLADEQLKSELEIILTTMEDEEQFSIREEEGSCDEESALAVHPALGFASSL